MLRRVLLPAAIAAVAACGDTGRGEPVVEGAVQPASSELVHQRQDTPQPITPVAVDARALPAGAEYRGNVVAARRWTDALGDNLLILTRTDAFDHEPCEWEYCGSDQELYAYHYVQRDSGVALLWRTTDFIRECDVDMTVRMGHQTLEITDLDADGVAESTFLYILACRGDVSAPDMKLIMHEGAQKYAIRGTMDEDARMPHARLSEMRMDPSFETAPTSFRTFAIAHWKKFTPQSAWPEEFGGDEEPEQEPAG